MAVGAASPTLPNGTVCECFLVNKKATGGADTAIGLGEPAEASNESHHAPMISSYGGVDHRWLLALWFRCVMKYVSLDVWLQERPKSKIESH